MGALQQCRGGLNLDISLLYPLRHKMPVITVLSVNGRERLQMAAWQSPWGEALNIAGRCSAM